MVKMPKEDALYVKSKIREHFKTAGCNTSGEVLDGEKLNSVIITVLDNAIARAKANGRKTIQEKDL